MFDNFKAIAPDQRLSSANRQKEDAGGRELIENVLDLGGGHFSIAVVLQIAMLAPFVAPIGDVQMHAQRNAAMQRTLVQLGHQAHAIFATSKLDSRTG